MSNDHSRLRQVWRFRRHLGGTGEGVAATLGGRRCVALRLWDDGRAMVAFAGEGRRCVVRAAGLRAADGSSPPDDPPFVVPGGLPPPAPGVSYVYVLALVDGRYYVGSTADLSRRLGQHRDAAGARWTAMYPPVAVAEWTRAGVRDDAWRMEVATTERYRRLCGEDLVRGGWRTRTRDRPRRRRGAEGARARRPRPDPTDGLEFTS